jgi:hypothetical protein
MQMGCASALPHLLYMESLWYKYFQLLYTSSIITSTSISNMQKIDRLGACVLLKNI